MRGMKEEMKWFGRNFRAIKPRRISWGQQTGTNVKYCTYRGKDAGKEFSVLAALGKGQIFRRPRRTALFRVCFTIGIHGKLPNGCISTEGVHTEG